ERDSRREQPAARANGERLAEQHACRGSPRSGRLQRDDGEDRRRADSESERVARAAARRRSHGNQDGEGGNDRRPEHGVKRTRPRGQRRFVDGLRGVAERLPPRSGGQGREEERDRSTAHEPPPKRWISEKTAGPSRMRNMAGKIRKMSGKRILIGAFWARSSAEARRRLRISPARFRMISPIETPSVCPWRTDRTNERIAGVSARVSMLRSASSAESPMLCS